MIKHFIFLSIFAVFLSGCNAIVEKQTKSEPAPVDFVVEQDSTEAIAALGELSGFDHQVIFNKGQYTINESEQARLLDWIQATQPDMIGVRGTGGAERHRELGNNRATAIIEFIQSRHLRVDAVILEYDATLLGTRGLIKVIPPALAAQIKTTAPILIISSN